MLKLMKTIYPPLQEHTWWAVEESWLFQQISSKDKAYDFKKPMGTKAAEETNQLR